MNDDLKNMQDPELMNTWKIKTEKLTENSKCTSPGIYKGDEYYGIATNKEKGEEMVAAMNAAPEPTRDIGDTMEDERITVKSDNGDEFVMVDDRHIHALYGRITASESAHITATDLFDALKDIVRDHEKTIANQASLARSQQIEINSMNTRINSQRNRTNILESKVELNAGRIKSREEVESND